jgi:hypothetical protein
MDLHSPAAGAQHASIEEALEASDADGTRSILDMERIGQTPSLGVVVPLPLDQLEELYGTQQPTRKMIEQNMEFLDDMERGEGVYLIVYEGEALQKSSLQGFPMIDRSRLANYQSGNPSGRPGRDSTGRTESREAS